MSYDLDRRPESWTSRLPGALLTVGVMLAVLWILEMVDAAMNGRLDAYGIRPRTVSGLEGIPAAPFLHAGFQHLISNSFVFAVLGVIAYVSVTLGRFVALIAITALSSGLGAWAFGAPNTVVIGASGVIFGLLGFLLFRGVAERSAGAITVSIMMLVIYGGTISGVLPGVPFVSWQAHLFGFIGGAFAAFWLRSPRPARSTYY
ncbi:MAG: rhomboid family intramembrane serine protease [Marmoricola sp.]